LRDKIEMEDPQDIGKYLGCKHILSVEGVAPNRITTIQYDMTEYFFSAKENYENVTGLKLKYVESPFVPIIDGKQLDKLMATPGQLGPHAASFLMKLLFGVRMALPFISVPVQRLSRYITKWTAECDRRLHRLFCFVYSFHDWVLTAKVRECNNVAELVIELWPDSDLNGDIMHTKSTSGFFMDLSTCEPTNDETPAGVPLAWGCKKQGSSAFHTPEAEVVSLSLALRSEALPMQFLMQKVLNVTVPIRIHEDNNGCIIACEKGYSPNMRYLPRTQRCSLGFIHDVITDPELSTRIVYQTSKSQKGDLFTKELAAQDFWHDASLIGYAPLVKPNLEQNSKNNPSSHHNQDRLRGECSSEPNEPSYQRPTD